MIDLRELRDHPDLFRDSQRKRGEQVSLVDDALAADVSHRAALAEYEGLRAEQKSLGKEVARAKGADKAALVARAKELAAKVKAADAAATQAEALVADLTGKISNLVLPEVPEGGEEDFETVRTVGTARDFAAEGFTPADHLDLMEGLHALDMGRGAKVGGARFYFLTGIGFRLELALLTMAMDQALANGFTPMGVPTLVKPEVMRGTGFLVQHSDEIYHLGTDDLYLTGTSEVALAGYHEGEILDLSDGPERLMGWSTCYRREAGSYGKDTRGIVRVHQFQKAEMFVYCHQEDAAAEHERLLAWEEEMLGKVELPYRVINIAGGDLGSSAARKFDCEAWVPTQHTYREMTSTSNCTTYQARRLNIRERTEKGTRPVATLNGTLATTRWIVAILENHQQPDGSVVVPAALRPYLGGLEVLTPAVALQHAAAATAATSAEGGK